MKDYYKILGVPPDAKQEQIREQYRHAVISCHPDKFTNLELKRQAEEKIKELNEAYAVLSDLEQRAVYDRQRSRGKTRAARSAVTARHPSPRPTQTAWEPPVTPVEDWVARPISNRIELDHLHYPFSAFRGDILEVMLDRPANVILLDSINYARYRYGISFHYLGGFVEGSPARLSIPLSGEWHLVIDQGGYPAALRVAVRLIHESW
jgi:curved DNA-binding protein CbpA